MITCPATGKITHPTAATAKQHLRELRAKGGERLNIYRCNECGGWHVGHNPIWLTRDIRRALRKGNR